MGAVERADHEHESIYNDSHNPARGTDKHAGGAWGERACGAERASDDFGQRAIDSGGAASSGDHACGRRPAFAGEAAEFHDGIERQRGK
jgi:hypothetical protein